MSIIKIKKRENPYASIDKSAIMDTRLSWKARGLLCYLLAMPNNWRANVEHLVTQGIDKRHAVREGLNELRSLGYAELVKTKDENGKLSGSEWHIFEEPKATEEKPDNRKSRKSENPTLGKSNTNNTILNNTINNKKEEKESAPSNAVATPAFEFQLPSNPSEVETPTSKPKGQENKQGKERAVSTLVIPTELQTPAFAEVWGEWMEQPKQKKKPQSAHLSTLNRLAKYPPAFAVTLVELAVQGNYQGCIFQDTPQAFERWKKAEQQQPQHTPPTPAEIGTAKRNAHLEELQKRGLRRPTPQQ